MPEEEYQKHFAQMAEFVPSRVKGFQTAKQLSEFERQTLIAEIDALTAIHHRLQSNELELILDWFRKIPDEVKESVRDYYSQINVSTMAAQ